MLRVSYYIYIHVIDKKYLRYPFYYSQNFMSDFGIDFFMINQAPFFIKLEE